ncbi:MULTISPECIES: tRNA (adenosine(37)-N6)-dimethylallyltransferase MiaA [unclassified Pedobacter]|uniref:tRNA (adenosine(37)-N6)-dimethylallyltransferase MiaA n=1 Tax=unclassified Pedobacter TaxID=2628915 RepID=UPI001DCD7C04|nr:MULTISPECIES: tRNA (adenosine(37)-N6)-dimethylallyltransferase MiaA [unclassified Pedobacter]CAH0157421.1 tRNA dimethylallyltransferase [Pedobacter sp. Bi126]CAH0200848.1 tRNA dimethylallyltransferase [Pedobacter sp. Bi36]
MLTADQTIKKSKTLISIVGPTAIGKTALAIQLAQHFNTEIISADSRQFFKEMAIGTAKPDADELAAAKHHFIDSHSVSQLFSTGDFEIEGLNILDQIFKKHNLAIMVGGSGLYVNALINGLDEMPDIDLAIRERLNKQFEEEGLSSIQKQLATLDPEYFAKVDQQNPQRMIRGLEVFLSTGQKLSSMLSATKKERPFNIIKIGLNTDRAILYDRINRRVDKMIADGLVEEVKSLIPFKKYNALNTVGYSELFDYLDGKLSLEDAVSAIKQNTRRFAKRQLTWFRRDEEINWFEPIEKERVINFIHDRLK